MIRQKKKKCADCGNYHPLYGHGLCKYCYNKKKAKEYKEKKLTAERPAKKERIKQVSEKQGLRNAEYKIARLEFLLEKDHCEICTEECLVPYPIINPTEVLEVHHKAGRHGSLLTDKRYFIAVCRNCHRIAEDHPQWAYDNGYSIPRHQIKE